jgi:hypothetical protein
MSKPRRCYLRVFLESSESMFSVPDNAWSYVWVIVIARKDASSHDLNQVRRLANKLERDEWVFTVREGRNSGFYQP